MGANFWFQFYKICVQNQWRIKSWDPSSGLWHWWSELDYHYDGLLLCFSILTLWTLCGKLMRGEQKALFCQFLFFGGALIVRGWVVVVWDKKSYLGPANITSFSSWDFSQSYKHDIFWHVVLTGYFSVLFFWDIAVSDFHPLEIYKKLKPFLFFYYFYSQHPAIQITISVNIFICFRYYTVCNYFFY